MIEYKHIKDVAYETSTYIEDRKTGKVKSIKTPWKKLNDNNLGGFQWGDFILIPAMSGAGKTAFAAQFTREIHDLNPDEEFIIVFFTFEMKAFKILLRDIIANTGIPRKQLLSADEDNKIDITQQMSSSKYLTSIMEKDIYFVEKPCTSKEYAELCRDFNEKTGKKVIAIGDHSLLFKNKKALDERGSLVDIAGDLVELKNEGWSMHIMLSQLNRDIETAVRRTPGSPLNYPQKSDIFGSDAVYQAADNVIFIHRPHLLKFVGNTYGPDLLSTDTDNVYFHCIKLREGEPVDLIMRANFKKMEILDDFS